MVMAFRTAVFVAYLGLAGAVATHGTKAVLKAAVRATNREDLEVPSGKIVKVINMLENLIKEMDAEQAADTEQFEAFTAWCVKTKASTEQSIEELKTTIETLTASLAQLYAKKEELETDLKRLKGEIKQTRTQIAQAQQKRAEEKASFQKEQLDFDASIKACGKAVEILAQHYGDGTTKEAEKPDFMSLVQVAHTLREAVDRRGLKVLGGVRHLLDGPTEFGRFEGKTGEALSIVDQVKVLADTFAEDKQSAIDQENKLQKTFNSLMKEKSELLASLIQERDAQQAVLDQTNQQIGEQETAKAQAERELKDEQEYLSMTTKMCDDTAKLYEVRKADREAEKVAVTEAVKILGGSAGEEFFLQTRGAAPSLVQVSKSKVRTTLFSRSCPRCRKAAMMLQGAASQMRSELLASAAAATMGSDAVADVITALEQMIERIKEDAKVEKEHKDWCVDEITQTTQKKENHEANVEVLKGEIADETEVIAEKTVSITQTASIDETVAGRHPEHGQIQGEGDNEKAAIDTADRNFEQATEFRAQEKAAYEKEHADYKEALAALNQAIDLLSKFYREKKKKAALIEEGSEDGVAPRTMAPGVFDSAYESKGGAGVIEMIATVRGEFEHGLKDLEEAEAKAVADYTKMKEEYHKTLTDLVGALNALIVQRDTSRNAKDEFEESKKENENEIVQDKKYLLQLQGSCNTLLEHYVERVELRAQETAAIKKAIKVLEEES